MTDNSDKTKKKNIESVYLSLSKAVEKISCKDRYTGRDFETIYRSHLKMFYEKIVKLPFPFQIGEAKKMFKILKKDYGIIPDSFSYDDPDEKKYYDYIKEISELNPDYLAEINSIKRETYHKREMIKTIINSREFRVGTLITRLGRVIGFCDRKK